jgi:adenylate cyclase, class 1
MPDEGIDRKQLRSALERFRSVNAARLQRVREMLSERHRIFVDLLPLLLHANHPTLPGYISPHTPCGISGYTPDTTTIDLAKRLSRSFNWARPAISEAGVHALFMMGSSGTIGHSDSSDIDIWVCYPETLDPEALALLQKKAMLLQDWADSLDLEAHFFLMNGEKFRRGQREPLTGENCGTAQHYLLIDEFYRTGILLAGRVPAWWLVPPARETSYAEFSTLLVRKRFMGGVEMVDFGGVDRIPAGEFIGAGVWQLYKAIESPHKSVLKLLLFEVYAANLPKTMPLSLDFKRAIYSRIVDIDELDPYVLIYRRIERHLHEREETQRLEIARRCLYYKAGKKLSQAPRQSAKSWQRKLMERLTLEWGWDHVKIAMLDSRSHWNIQQVAAERNELVRELNYSYRFLSECARYGGADAKIDAQEFNVLGRRLMAAYERKAGKIEILNPGQSIAVAEGELSFCALPNIRDEQSESSWAAFAELVPPNGEPTGVPIAQTTCLTELIAWCVLNGVIGEQTRIAVRETRDGLRAAEVEAMVREIRAHIVAAAAPAMLEDAVFLEDARPVSMLAFVNVAVDPLAEAHRLGVHRVSSRTDSLGYSALRENLVRNIETLTRNSWGEFIVARYTEESGLIRCLREYQPLSASTANGGAPPIKVSCFCVSRSTAIAQRVGQLFDDIGASRRNEPRVDNLRYVLEIQDTVHVINLRRGEEATRTARSPDELYRLLGEAQADWSPLVIDRYALRDTPLPLISELIQPFTISVFFETNRDSTLITIVDEYGSWFHADYAAARENSLLASIDQFLASVRLRQGAPGLTQSVPRYFRLQHAAGRSPYTAMHVQPPLDYRNMKFLNVQAIAELDDAQATRYTVWCDGESFSEELLGPDFHEAVSRRIVELRRTGEHYPVYITDLDLSSIVAAARTGAQTSLYLQHKHRLEARINQALARAAPER